MLQLYVPYLIAVSLGMDVSANEATIVADVQEESAVVASAEPETTAPVVEAAPTEETASVEEAAPVAEPAPVASAREPEPQVPTGKYTTAVEIRPIVGMTKGNWASVRLYEGQDLLYFTSLLTWRCGLWEIRYGINGAPADQVLEMEPCHEDTGQPNAMTDPTTYPVWATFPGETIETVYIEIVFDDGTTDFARFDRNQILIP